VRIDEGRLNDDGLQADADADADADTEDEGPDNEANAFSGTLEAEEEEVEERSGMGVEEETFIPIEAIEDEAIGVIGVEAVLFLLG
jgi:hypothetical protein